MPGKTVSQSVSFFLLFAVAARVPAFGGSLAVGSVAASTNATKGGQPLLPDTLVFSGETISVNDGAAVITTTNGNRVVLGKQTRASFLQESSELAVRLDEGSLSVYHGSTVGTLRIQAGEISVVPEMGFTTSGQVAVVNGGVVVTSKTGMLRVEGEGEPIEVPQGKTMTVQPRTAHAPQVAASGGGSSHLPTIVSWVGLGTGVMGTVVGFDALHRANNASDAASNASAAAAKATATASAAAQAAAAAANAASAATQAASSAVSLATAAAALGLEAANVVGCDLNKFANSLGQPSPYTPPSNLTCK
jgi:hypothetical protein